MSHFQWNLRLVLHQPGRSQRSGPLVERRVWLPEEEVLAAGSPKIMMTSRFAQTAARFLFVLAMTLMLQWNLRGFRANHADLHALVAAKTPVVVALQETKLKPEHSCTLQHYKSYRFDHPSTTVAHGGVALLVHNGVASTPYRLQTDLQAVAATVDLRQFKVTVVSLYIPPEGRLPADSLQRLVRQLPSNYLLLGDFNTHSTVWGCQYTNSRGRLLEDFIHSNNLCILNNGSPTHIALPSGSSSAIDLSLSSATVFDRFRWRIHMSPCGSDHFPIWLWSETPHPGSRTPQWNLRKADWTGFTADCVLDFNAIDLSADALNEQLCDDILRAANQHIPKTSSLPKRIPVPWWSDDCQRAIRERRRCFRAFSRRPTTDNLIHFRKAKAVARRTIREAKRSSWTAYITTLNRFTPLTLVWRRIHRVSGRGTPIPLPVLTLPGGSTITDPSEVANLFGQRWSERWRVGTTDPTFLRHKRVSERVAVDFSCSVPQAFNDPFTFDELQRAIRRLRSTAAGPDLIHNDMLKNLNSDSLRSLLTLFNHIWTTHEFPSAWREATVIPILKQDKEGSDPLHYRPIALTSCVCKLMERMVNERLVWFLESTGFFDSAQCGFRRNRCTTDHLISLDTAVRRSFASKQHTFAVFFDIEKAYDTAWRHAILRKLRSAGVRGHMGYFIANFVKERFFRVKVGSSLSEKFLQESGVPQGSVLSVTLFGILINDIGSSLPPTVHRSLFVDDFAIWVSTSTSVSAQRQLQICIDGLAQWSLLNGFKFSTGKTVCLHFCRRTRYCPDIVLRLYGQRIPIKTETKFLGMTFDRRLSYGPHIALLRGRCTSRSNILKVVSRMSYGADRTTLLRLYHALIMSVLDYGSIVYDAALKSTKVALDSVHHACIRTATGAFRTSRRASLLVDAGEVPLDLRRKRLALRYVCGVKQDPDHPAYSWIFDEALVDRFLTARQSSSQALCTRVHCWLRETNIDLDSLTTRRFSTIEPWRMTAARCDLELLQHTKSSLLPEEFRHHALERLAHYADFRIFFTDGSKGDVGVGCAFVSGTTTRRFRLPDTASVFTSELYAIYQVLKHIRRRGHRKCLIATDSASSAMALRDQTTTSSLIMKILEILTDLYSEGVEVKLLWVPSHVGVEGNEKADQAARAASRSPNVRRVKVESGDLRPLLDRLVRDEWQDRWRSEPDCAMKRLRPTIDSWESSCRRSRVEEVALTRLRIGHCYATHSHFLSASEPPVCAHCDAPLSVRHVLSPSDSCEQLKRARSGFFPDASLDDILGNEPTVPIQQVLSYLQHIKFYIVYNPGLAQAARPTPTTR